MFRVESPLERDVIATLLWSAKESALKAMSAGLRLDTRSVVVNRRGMTTDGDASSSWRPTNGNGWSPLQVEHSGNRVFYGWWRLSDHFIRTVVADPAPLQPRALSVMRAAA